MSSKLHFDGLYFTDNTKTVWPTAPYGKSTDISLLEYKQEFALLSAKCTEWLIMEISLIPESVKPLESKIMAIHQLNLMNLNNPQTMGTLTNALECSDLQWIGDRVKTFYADIIMLINPTVLNRISNIFWTYMSHIVPLDTFNILITKHPYLWLIRIIQQQKLPVVQA